MQLNNSRMLGTEQLTTAMMRFQLLVFLSNYLSERQGNGWKYPWWHLLKWKCYLTISVTSPYIYSASLITMLSDLLLYLALNFCCLTFEPQADLSPATCCIFRIVLNSGIIIHPEHLPCLRGTLTFTKTFHCSLQVFPDHDSVIWYLDFKLHQSG